MGHGAANARVGINDLRTFGEYAEHRHGLFALALIHRHENAIDTATCLEHAAENERLQLERAVDAGADRRMLSAEATQLFPMPQHVRPALPITPVHERS